MALFYVSLQETCRNCGGHFLGALVLNQPNQLAAVDAAIAIVRRVNPRIRSIESCTAAVPVGSVGLPADWLTGRLISYSELEAHFGVENLSGSPGLALEAFGGDDVCVTKTIH